MENITYLQKQDHLHPSADRSSCGVEVQLTEKLKRKIKQFTNKKQHMRTNKLIIIKATG